MKNYYNIFQFSFSQINRHAYGNTHEIPQNTKYLGYVVSATFEWLLHQREIKS